MRDLIVKDMVIAIWLVFIKVKLVSLDRRKLWNHAFLVSVYGFRISG